LAAVEEHERGCAHWLHNLLPEGLQSGLFSGDEDELALTLLDIVEPLQYPLSVRSTPDAIAEVTNVETADPACSACFGTPFFVCFDFPKLSVFESA